MQHIDINCQQTEQSLSRVYQNRVKTNEFYTNNKAPSDFYCDNGTLTNLTILLKTTTTTLTRV